MIPKLTRSCKVARCEICGSCRRCGCDHDGAPPDIKKAREQGQHGPPKRPVKWLKRLSDTYKTGELFESPMATEKRQKGKYSLTIPSDQEKSDEIQPPTDLFKAFGIEAQLPSWHAHIPTIDQRADPGFWRSHDNVKITVVMNAVGAIAKMVCSTICGGHEDADLALWETFLLTLYKKNVPQEAVFRTILECYSLAKKSSTEMRGLRAALCAMKHGSEWNRLLKATHLQISPANWKPKSSNNRPLPLDVFPDGIVFSR